MLALHLAWIAWVIFGAAMTRRQPLLRWLHIGSLLYGIAVETIGFTCPLTIAENWLMMRGGIAPYSEPFMIHYLNAIVYPDIPPILIETIGVAVCVVNLCIYAFRFFGSHRDHTSFQRRF